MASNNINKYPPKFSENIYYPAIYKLDEYDIPPEYDYDALGNPYFNILFHNGYGNSINSMPYLSYGKHKFDITLLQQDDNAALNLGLYSESFPSLKLSILQSELLNYNTLR